MEMLQRMNDCIDYIEDNLQEKIELDQLAHITLSSKFHFQRKFHIVTGFTVADYIRRRRLTLAAQELTDTGRQVIDVAFQYVYEMPEAFSKEEIMSIKRSWRNTASFLFTFTSAF